MVDLRVGVDLVVAAGTSVWSMGGAGVVFVEVASWVGLVVLRRLIHGVGTRFGGMALELGPVLSKTGWVGTSTTTSSLSFLNGGSSKYVGIDTPCS
ncbi:hypothetical protein S245_018553 [Arachis hypogaea]